MPPVPKPSSAKKGRNRNLIIAIVAAVVVAAALIGGSLVLRGGSSDSSATTATSASPTSAVGLVAGIPQSGTTLGNPNAVVKMKIFEDIQCPFCRQFTEGALPGIVNEYVRPGRVQLDWRGMAFLGPDSTKALEISLAAAKQNKLWEVIGGFYAHQGAENSGWVTDALVDEVLAAVPGLDAGKVKADAKTAAVKQEAAKIQADATANEISATPSFLIVRGVDKPYQIQVTSLTTEAFRPALDDALKG